MNSRPSPQRRLPLWLFALSALLIVPAARGELVITEIMAVADAGFPDEDGQPSDWIEITNTGASGASLDGLYLTNSAGDPTRWAFPAGVNVDGGASLVVFASGKNRTPVPGQLHTGFTLDAGGDYLGLIAADGTTVVSEMAPSFPAQYEGISYGVGQAAGSLEVFVPLGSEIRYHVQDAEGTDLLGDTWKQAPASFDDSGWASGTGALGFETGTSGNLWDLIVTNIAAAMKNVNPSGYFRFPFDYSATGKAVASMQVRVFIDDAFVAHLNGTEIGSFAKPDPLLWNSGVPSSSTRGDQQSVSTPIVIDVTAFAGSLIDGANVLAIQGINTTGGSDFAIDAELTATVEQAGANAVFGYSETPTPGGANGDVKAAPPADIGFSASSKLFTDDFDLILSCATPGATIRYTTDLSVPSNASGAESPEYTGPIRIDASTQVRARAFLTGALDGATRTETFLKMDANVAAFDSDLPVIVMSTLGGGAPYESSSTLRRTAYMFVFEPDPITGRTTLTGPPAIASRAGIRKRGSSSAGWPKYAMSVETWNDGDDEDRSIEPLGFAKEADWIMSARWNFDRALIRNPFIYDISRQLGRYAVRTRFVEVFNDVESSIGLLDDNPANREARDYFGVYSLMEKIEADPNRVEIARIMPWENGEPEVSGGYIFKRDRNDAGGPPTYSVAGAGGALIPHDPGGLEVSAQQKTYIEGYLTEMNSAIVNRPSGINTTSGLHFSDYLDIDSFIDHHWLNTLAMNVDWGRLSAYYHKDRNDVVNAGPIWDFDRNMGSEDGRDDVPTAWDGGGDSSMTWFDSRYPWFGNLIGPSADPAAAYYPDVRQRHTDRWAELRAGAFATANIHATIDGMADEIREAQARNFVRWSDRAPNGGNFAEPGTSGWEAEISHMKGWLQARVEWIDSQYIGLPVLNTAGGVVANGFGLTMGSGASQIWYTDDGSDPRAPGGSPAAGASQYSAAVPISTTQLVTARSYDGAQWGAPAEVVLVVSDQVADDSNLVISELMYRPASPSAAEIAAGFDDQDDFEYAEIENIAAGPVALLGVEFVDGVLFDFNDGPIMVLGPGERALVVRNRAAFEHRYGTTHSGRIVGEFQGDTQLNNGGEQIVLAGFDSAVIRDFSYEDEAPWPEAADGDGYSLVLIAPDTNPDHTLPTNWRSSVAMGGSPGFSDADSFAAWSTANGGISAGSDLDNDGREALREYAEGTPPGTADAETMVFGSRLFVVGGVADDYLTIAVPRNLAADDVLMTPEVSGDLGVWAAAPEALVLVEEVNNGDGTATLLFRSSQPIGMLPAGEQFRRLRYELR